jgi:NitT/TauT family transport system ATP-binding protein
MPWLTVEQNIHLALPRMDPPGRRRRTAEVLEMVGLRGFDTARPHELSGGMRQKVSIARALVMEAPLLLMDEPFSSLDEQTRLRLNREVVDLWKGQNKTFLFITHSIQEALVLGTRVVLLSVRPGKIAGQWVPGDKKPPLDSPEFAALAGEIRNTLGLCCPPVDNSSGKECCSE